MKSKKIVFLISILLISSLAKAETCSTSNGLSLTTGTNDNIYQNPLSGKTLKIKVRSKIFDLNEGKDGEKPEAVRVGKELKVNITSYGSTSSYYMLLSSEKEKE